LKDLEKKKNVIKNENVIKIMTNLEKKIKNDKENLDSQRMRNDVKSDVKKKRLKKEKMT